MSIQRPDLIKFYLWNTSKCVRRTCLLPKFTFTYPNPCHGNLKNSMKEKNRIGFIFRRRGMTFLIFLVLFFNCCAQKETRSTFEKQKSFIDSCIKSNNANNAVTNMRIVGDSRWGKFHADTYFFTSTREIFKIEYQFFSDSPMQRTCHYCQFLPMNIVSDSITYYYLEDKIFTNEGEPAEISVSQDLIKFEQELKKLVFSLLSF